MDGKEKANQILFNLDFRKIDLPGLEASHSAMHS